jgi:hypothetical protein
MAQEDEEFDSTAEPELEEGELEEGDLALDDELDDESDESDEAEDLELNDLDEGATVVETEGENEAEKPAATKEDDEDVVLELDDELHPDDVEEPLDVLLKERTAAATLEDDEEEIEEEEVDVDERGEGPARIVPRRPGEFLCKSCFLVLPRNQLADEARMFCRDCA